MTLDLEIQIDCTDEGIPDASDFRRWMAAVLQNKKAEITLRIVDKAESAYMNSEYRKKEGPTNVLSFFYDDEENHMLQGDILICAAIVSEEAKQMSIPALSHWAHLTVHACYHLLGYDHQSEKEAKIMEDLETKILSSLGFDDPYAKIYEIND